MLNRFTQIFSKINDYDKNINFCNYPSIIKMIYLSQALEYNKNLNKCNNILNMSDEELYLDFLNSIYKSKYSNEICEYLNNEYNLHLKNISNIFDYPYDESHLYESENYGTPGYRIIIDKSIIQMMINQMKCYNYINFIIPLNIDTMTIDLSKIVCPDSDQSNYNKSDKFMYDLKLMKNKLSDYTINGYENALTIEELSDFSIIKNSKKITNIYERLFSTTNSIGNSLYYNYYIFKYHNLAVFKLDFNGMQYSIHEIKIKSISEL